MNVCRMSLKIFFPKTFPFQVLSPNSTKPYRNSPQTFFQNARDKELQMGVSATFFSAVTRTFYT